MGDELKMMMSGLYDWIQGNKYKMSLHEQIKLREDCRRGFNDLDEIIKHKQNRGARL
jgi:hypothetical protein